MASTMQNDAGSEQTMPSERGEPSRSREIRRRRSRAGDTRRSKEQQWRAEFPYHWREDDLVTRRDTLRFLAAGSGALFVASGILAIASNFHPSTAVNMTRIARVDEIGLNQWRVFDYPDGYGQGIVINLPDGNGKGHLVAYSDVCTHLSCAVLYDGNGKTMHCPCHDGYFDAQTGEVIGGPPTRPLPVIQLAIHDGVLYAVKEIER